MKLCEVPLPALLSSVSRGCVTLSIAAAAGRSAPGQLSCCCGQAQRTMLGMAFLRRAGGRVERGCSDIIYTGHDILPGFWGRHIKCITYMRVQQKVLIDILLYVSSLVVTLSNICGCSLHSCHAPGRTCPALAELAGWSEARRLELSTVLPAAGIALLPSSR